MFLTVLKTGKSEIKVSTGSIPDEDSSWFARRLSSFSFPTGQEGLGESALVSLSLLKVAT